MKKITFLVFLFIFGIISVGAASKYECTYSIRHKSFSVTYSLEEKKVSLESVYLTTDYVTNKEVTETYREWFEAEYNNGFVCPETIDVSEGTLKLGSKKQTGSNVSCGNITGIPSKVPELTSLAFTMVQIAVPVILVIMGSIDLFKGIIAQKEDEIKKGRQIFIKRLIVAAIIFFSVIVTKFLVSVVAKNEKNHIVDCIDCFISNDC